MEHSPPTVADILESLRGRVLRAVQSGALGDGDRLPSARDLAPEFEVDHRVVLAAYRQLADEGLVELRQRGGIYVRVRHGAPSLVAPLPERWMADVLTQALAREIPAPELHEWLRRSLETLRLRVAVVTTTPDQAFGLCRELRDDFGMEADAVLADELVTSGAHPLPIRRADLLLTTAAHADRVEALGAELQKPVTVIELRPDLTVGEWALLLRQPVYAIVASEKFGQMLRDFFKDVPGVENLHTMVFGTDDLSTIPMNAPTYVTQHVRAQLAGVSIPGRILPAARTISMQSAHEIFGFIVRSNLEAMARRNS
jgi:DNA-binding transcriptional regulator YhcF (GntR family)